jgi:hypothetical protein
MDAPSDLPFPHVSQAYLMERHVTALDGTPLPASPRPAPFPDSHHDHYHGRGQALATGSAAIRKMDSTRSDAR